MTHSLIIKLIFRYLRNVVCFLNLSAGLSSAEMQQIWKELTNGITEAKTTVKANQSSADNNINPTKVTTGRHTADQQSASPRRAEWYDFCLCAADKL